MARGSLDQAFEMGEQLRIMVDVAADPGRHPQGCSFEGGGLRANFARDHLPHDARRLACLTELLFGAAYRPAPDFDIAVVTKSLIEAEAARRRLPELGA